PKEIAPWLITPRGWEADIAQPDEPGGRFVIEGRVLGAGDSVPLAGVTLYAYHADGKGWYALTRDAPSPAAATACAASCPACRRGNRTSISRPGARTWR